MYKTIYVPVDNSDHSNMAVELGVEFAKVFGSKMVGSHVYAAKMHDKRFKQMEAGLPEEYHDEKEDDQHRGNKPCQAQPFEKICYRVKKIGQRHSGNEGQQY